MDETTQIFLSIILGIAVICGFSSYNSIKDNETVVEMIKLGADPLKASCAVKGSTELNKQLCHTLVK